MYRALTPIFSANFSWVKPWPARNEAKFFPNCVRCGQVLGLREGISKFFRKSQQSNTRLYIVRVFVNLLGTSSNRTKTAMKQHQGKRNNRPKNTPGVALLTPSEPDAKPRPDLPKFILRTVIIPAKPANASK
jgi:hypothetical protein